MRPTYFRDVSHPVAPAEVRATLRSVDHGDLIKHRTIPYQATRSSEFRISGRPSETNYLYTVEVRTSAVTISHQGWWLLCFTCLLVRGTSVNICLRSADKWTVVSIVKPRRCRSAAAYSRQTFPWTICRSVGTCVRVCVGLSSTLWKTADRIRMPFGTMGRTGPGMRQIAGFGIGPREGVLLWANLGRAIVTNGGLYGVGVRQCLNRRSCFRFVCENLTTFPFGKRIVGKLDSWAFWRYIRFHINVGVYEKLAKK